jgi:cation diffusion facilitator CzcD-associated flavoprotein CzcO
MADIQSTIHIENGYEKDAITYYPVVIVGAGAAGIGMACQLREQLGFDQFRLFDRQAGIGGTPTWRFLLKYCHTDLSKRYMVDQPIPWRGKSPAIVANTSLMLIICAFQAVDMSVPQLGQ